MAAIAQTKCETVVARPAFDRAAPYWRVLVTLQEQAYISVLLK